MLPMGLLVVVGTVGCRGRASPVGQKPEESRTVPKLGRSAAIAEIESLGGSYKCDEESPDKPIVTVYLGLTRVTDAELAPLGGLTHLQTLSLDATQITDAGLEHLKKLKSLELLGLGGTQVTDAGDHELKKALPNCQILR